MGFRLSTGGARVAASVLVNAVIGPPEPPLVVVAHKEGEWVRETVCVADVLPDRVDRKYLPRSPRHDSASAQKHVVTRQSMPIRSRPHERGHRLSKCCEAVALKEGRVKSEHVKGAPE